jgi:hypothetical protein
MIVKTEVANFDDGFLNSNNLMMIALVDQFYWKDCSDSPTNYSDLTMNLNYSKLPMNYQSPLMLADWLR